MFKNIISPNYTGITSEDLTAIEKEYNFTFPEDLKEFYLKYNAGKLEKKIIRLSGDDYLKFHCFYSIKMGYTTLEETLKIIYFDDWWVKWLIPFGYDEGGNDFCFSIRDFEYGSIYYFDSECIDEDHPENYLIRIGGNFTDFINSME